MKKYEIVTKRIMAFTLAVCLFFFQSAFFDSFEVYAEGREDVKKEPASIIVDMDKICSILEESSGKGLNQSYHKLPEKVKQELQSSVLVGHGVINEVRYYIVASMVKDTDDIELWEGDDSDYAKGLKSLWVICVNLNNKAVKAPNIQVISSDTRKASISSDTQLIWEGEEDWQEQASPMDAAVYRATDTDALFDADAADVLQPESASKTGILLDMPDLKANNSKPMDFITDFQIVKDGKGTPFNPNELVETDGYAFAKFTYRIPDNGGVEKDIPYTFGFPKELNMDQSKDFTLKFEADQSIIANGRVDTASNEAFITFNENAVDKGCLKPESTGEFYVMAQFDRDEIGNGGKKDITFQAGSYTENIVINFKVNPIKAEVHLEKTGEKQSGNIIKWTIKVTPSMEDVWKADDKVLKSLVIADLIPAGQKLNYVPDSLKVTDPDGHDITTGSFQGFTDVGNGEQKAEYAFPADKLTGIGVKGEADRSYYITYNTSFGLDAWGGGSDEADFKNQASGRFSYDNYTQAADGTAVKTELIGGKIAQKEANVKVQGNFVSKSGVASAADKSITWTITLNANQFDLTDAKFKDELKLGGEPFTGTIRPGSFKVKKGSASEETITPDPQFQNGEFEYALGNLNDKVTITYVVEGLDDYFKNNKTSVFQNTVRLTDTSISVEGTPGMVSIGNRLIQKSGTYYPKDHKLIWKITVNQDEINLSGDIKIEDTIPNGLKYIGSSCDSQGATLSYNNPKFIAELPQGYSKKAVITIETEVEDSDKWAMNYSGTPFTNTAKLIAGGMLEKEYTVSSSPEVSSKVIEKEGLSSQYDPVTKQAVWKLAINQNGMDMTTPVVTDRISQGQKFVDGSITPSDLVDVYDYDGNILKIQLKDLSSPAELSYKTEVTDFTDLDSNGVVSITNEAELQCDQMEHGPQKVSASQVISKTALKKEGQANNKEGTITWRVTVNENRTRLSKPKLIDVLDKDLVLKTESVTLKNLDTGLNEPVAANQIQYQEQSDNRFIFEFSQDIQEEYLLEFDTYIAANKTYANTIQMYNHEGALLEEGVSQGVKTQYMEGGGSGFPAGNESRGSVKLIKTDDKGQSVAGCTFDLLSEKGVVIRTGVTDSKGEYLFEGLMPGKYQIVETDAPIEYIVDSVPQPVEIKKGQTSTIPVTNRHKVGKLVIHKEDLNNNHSPLAGAEFTLYIKNSDQSLSAAANGIKISDADGTVTYENLEAQRYGYVIQETKAPEGFVLNGSEKKEFNITSDGEEVIWNIGNSKQNDNIINGGNSSSGSSGKFSGSGGKNDLEKGPGVENGFQADSKEKQNLPGYGGLAIGRVARLIPEHLSEGMKRVIIPDIPGSMVEIWDMAGNMVYRGNTDSESGLDLELESGDYILYVIGDEGVPLGFYEFVFGEESVQGALPKTGRKSDNKAKTLIGFSILLLFVLFISGKSKKSGV